MDLSRTVACTALLLVVVLSAGHARAQNPAAKRSAVEKVEACVIKPVMTDAEIQTCRIAFRGR